MLVQNWMTRPVVTISTDARMPEAIELLKTHKIHALPVIKKDKLVGLVTDSDLKRASASDATTLEIHELAYLIQKIKIAQIMSPDPITIRIDHTLSEAADLFLQRGVPVLPIMAGKKQLVGILSRSDIARAFLCLSASGRRGLELGMQIEDRPGATLAMIDGLRRYVARLGSLISIDDSVPEGFRKVYFRVYGFEQSQRPALLSSLEEHGRLLFFVDHEQETRKIYAPM